MRTVISYILTLCLSSILNHSLFAAPFSSEPYPVEYQLVCETDGVEPGQLLNLGLVFQHKEGWHTYWKNPGDVGLPPTIKWENLPEGFLTKEIIWSAPEVHKMGIIDVQSYHGEILHIHPIQVPANLEAGTKVTLKGKLSWMMCSRKCVPAWKNVSITLPVVKKAKTLDKWKTLFAKTRQSQPRTMDYKLKAHTEGNHIVLTVSPPLTSPLPNDREYWFFCNENHITTQSLPSISSDNQFTSIRMLKTEWAPQIIERLQGHLYLKKGWDDAGQIHNLLVDISLDSKDHQ